jgi:hypothetical protein
LEEAAVIKEEGRRKIEDKNDKGFENKKRRGFESLSNGI